MNESPRTYLPAAGKDWALPFYDPFVKLFGGDSARQQLIDQAELKPGLRILDIGCGTGTMAVQIKRQHPNVTVLGLDPDPKALARATQKATRANISIQFDRGFSDQLPYPDSSFDRVFSSLMYHHLPSTDKENTLREVHRVLHPGGSFHLLDFAGPEGHEHGLHGLVAHLFHARERFQDNQQPRILTLLQRAGFSEARKLANCRLIFGPVAYYRAS